MSKKVKPKLWVCICVIAGIFLVTILIVYRYYICQKNVFFTEYDGKYEKDYTIIYKYNSRINAVIEIGRVQGKLHDCVINSDETYITGVMYNEVFFDGVKIVRYDMVTGTVEMLDAAEKIATLTNHDAGLINSLIYNEGNKIFIHYEDENEDIKWLLYDLATDQYDIVEGENGRFLTIQNDNLWYIADDQTLCQYDLENKEKTIITESAHYDSAVMPGMDMVAYTKGSNEKINLYDMRTQKNSCIARGGWNTYYGDLNWTNSRWSDNGKEFFYIKSFPGLFNASTEQLMIYDVLTHRSRCIYTAWMTTNEFQYVAKR